VIKTVWIGAGALRQGTGRRELERARVRVIRIPMLRRKAQRRCRSSGTCCIALRPCVFAAPRDAIPSTLVGENEFHFLRQGGCQGLLDEDVAFAIEDGDISGGGEGVDAVRIRA